MESVRTPESSNPTFDATEIIFETCPSTQTPMWLSWSMSRTMSCYISMFSRQATSQSTLRYQTLSWRNTPKPSPTCGSSLLSLKETTYYCMRKSEFMADRSSESDAAQGYTVACMSEERMWCDTSYISVSQNECPNDNMFWNVNNVSPIWRLLFLIVAMEFSMSYYQSQLSIFL